MFKKNKVTNHRSIEEILSDIEALDQALTYATDQKLAESYYTIGLRVRDELSAIQ